MDTRKRWIIEALCGLTVVATVTALMGTSSSASTRIVHDRRGDVAAGGDITRVRVTNGPRKITVRTAIRRVERNHLFFLTIDTGTKGRYGYWLATRHRAGGGYKKVLYYRYFDGAGGEKVRCPALRMRVLRGRSSAIKVVIPQRCLGRHAGAARFSVDVSGRGSSAFDFVPRGRPLFVRRS